MAKPQKVTCDDCSHDEEMHMHNFGQCTAVYNDESFCTCRHFAKRLKKYPPVLGSLYHNDES